ncbi:FkbM family methyltransferase [Bradyrhizobium elkanii]
MVKPGPAFADPAEHRTRPSRPKIISITILALVARQQIVMIHRVSQQANCRIRPQTLSRVETFVARRALILKSACCREQPQRDLIFDFGLHRGFDSEFYLSKGFRVVGLEAVPSICNGTRERLSRFEERFTAVNKALSDRAGELASFYSVPEKDDWGSLSKLAAEKGRYQSIEIVVPTTDLHELLDQYGTPYYIKCDLEGADVIFRDQLARDRRRPVFVSLEVNSEVDIDILAEAGYDRGQIVNQWMHPFTHVPNPPSEGSYHEARFTGETSGLFGLELPREKWSPLEAVKDRYLRWRALKAMDENLAPGWVDVHVCTAAVLGA